MKDLKVALVHDYLREYGGAERVLEALHEIFPDAPIFTAYLNLNALGSHADKIRTWDIRSSWLQYVPFANYLVSPFRIFAPKIFEGFDLSGYDVVISSCNIYFSKAVKTTPSQLHISYIHTPPRYLYGYTTSFNYKKHWWTRIGGEIVNHFLRIADFKISQRPNILVANSKNVAERIKKFYRRDSVVIYPPVEVIKYQVSSIKHQVERQYFLSVGRLVKGKGIEKIVEACAKLGLPLKIAGTGSELEKLNLPAGRQEVKSKNSKNIEFLGQVDDKDLPELYAGAIATIVASEDEDFGIVPVESMACGTPVIAIKQGGFLETVVEGPSSHKASAGQGKTGEFFEDGSLEEVLKNFHPKKYNPEDCIKQAQKFSKERFKKEILELINKNFPVK